jgi:hypothetical protein
MALRELNAAAMVMMQSNRRVPIHEREEESIPLLQNASETIKAAAGDLQERILNVSGDIEFTQAQIALYTLPEPNPCQEITWGVDRVSLAKVKDLVERF